MSDKPNPFSIVASEPVIELDNATKSNDFDGNIPPTEEADLDIKTPLDRLIEKEIKTKKYVLAYYTPEGDTAYCVGDDMGAEEISFVTDIIKARVMMQLILE